MKIKSGIFNAFLYGFIGLFVGLFWYESYWTVVSLCAVIGFLFGYFFEKILFDDFDKKIKRIRQLKIQENEEFRLKMESQHGKPSILKYGLNHTNTYSVFEESKIIVINKQAIPYSNIRACELFVVGQTSTSTTEMTTKYLGGYMPGRAVVDTSTNYSVRLSTNNINEPTLIIDCHTDISFATNLVDTLNIIKGYEV